MNNNITLLIHGPFAGNCIDVIYKNYCKVKEKIIKTIIVSYASDIDIYKQMMENFPEWKVTFVVIKDVINAGFFNINRQIKSVNAGLSAIDKNCYVIKLRNDQSINFIKLFKILQKKDYFESETSKILTTNCYTRKDRLYHPSDMFLAGWYVAMKKYYSAPLMSDTHLSHTMKLQEEDMMYNKKYRSLNIVPESYLFRNYLQQNSWLIKEDKKDSFEALKRFIYIVNSWKIDFRWNKERTPYCKAGAVVLPCKFKLRPFNGVAKEKAKCYDNSQINNEFKTPKDWYYLIKSNLLFYIKYELCNKKHMLRTKLFLNKLMLLALSICPYITVERLVENLKKKTKNLKCKIKLHS